MEQLSWDIFKVHNVGKDLKIFFEELCIDYFIKKEQIKQSDLVIIDPNNPGIETQPINNGTLGIQSKFLGNTKDLSSKLKESFTKDRLINYKKLKEIIVISNVDFNTSSKSYPSNVTGYRNKKIKIKYINGKSFLRELKKEEFYNLQYTYFGINNLGGFLKNQQIKYIDYIKNGIDKTVISIKDTKNNKKITPDDFLNKQILGSTDKKPLLIAGSPGSGKSLLFTYFIDIISSSYLKDKILPICINLIKWDGSSIIHYINRNLRDYGLYEFNGFQKIIIFFDGWNEISSEKCEVLKTEIETLTINCKNILKIIISTRGGSIKNSLLEDLTSNYVINTLYKFKIDDFIDVSYKSIEQLPVLNTKKKKLNDFLGKIALRTNFYDENSPLRIDDLQKEVKSNLTLSSNIEVNSVIDFLFDTNIINKTNYGTLVFGDQKVYEYFLTKYISEYFFEELPILRKHNFFSKTIFVDNLIQELDKSFINRVLADKTVKNLFTNRFLSYSIEESGWGFSFSDLFLKTLLNLKGFEILINENLNIRNIFNTNYISPKTVYNFKLLGKFNEAKIIEKQFKKYRTRKIGEWNEWYEQNKEQDKLHIDHKFRELEVDLINEDYHYHLINNIKISKNKILGIFKKNSVYDPILVHEIVLFLIYLLEQNNITLFKKCILGANSKILYQKFIDELTKIDNLYLYKRIPKNVFEKLYDLHTFKKLILGLQDINYFSTDSNDIVSGIIIYLLYKKEFKKNLTKSHRQQLKDVIYQPNVFYKIGEFSVGEKFELEIKVIFIAALLDGEQWEILPLSNEYHKTYINGVRPLVGLCHWFICYIDGKRNDELIDVLLLCYDIGEKFYCYNNYQSGLDNLNSSITFSIINYLININKFSGLFFKTLIERKIKTNIIFSLLGKAIQNTNFKNFDYSVIHFLERKLKENIPFNEKYDISLMLSYLYSIKNNIGSANLYFEEALNQTYIRYGRRKDYFFDFVIDILSEGYKAGYINSEDVYDKCVIIGDLYNNLIDHVDGKGTRQIPALLIPILAESCSERINEFLEKYPDRKGGWFVLMGEFSGLLKRISKYENVETILVKIEELSTYYNSIYYKEIVTIELILLARLINIGYYAYGSSSEKIRSTLEKTIRDFPINSFKDLKSEINKFNRSDLDINLFISDCKNINLTLEGSIDDLVETNRLIIGDRISIADIDFSDDTVYDEILQNNNKYDISHMSEEDIGNLLEKFKNKFPNNYMEKIMNSKLFYYACGGMYPFYGEEFEKRFGIKLYSLNPGEFKKNINNKLFYEDGSYYFTNIRLVSEILIKENNYSDYNKLINNLMGFSKLLCL